jgi:large subunit ribosomal protein L22
MSSERFSYASTGLVRAEAKHVRSSARKVRLVLEDIRGRSVVDARRQLLFSPRAAAKDVELVLRSAVTNAEVNHGLSPDDLVVAEAFANEGVTIKRFKPRARGRASRINKRTSHITILLRSLTDGGAVAGDETAAAPKQASSDSARARRVAASKKADGAEVETAAAEAAVEAAPKKPRAAKPKADATVEAASDATAEKKPAAKKPAAKKPAAEKPAAEKKPAARKPAAKKPAAEKPATDEGKD